MPAPFSYDLRLRVIWFVEGLKFSFEDTAFFLGVSKRTVQRYLAKVANNDPLQNKQLGRPFGSHSLTPREELIIFEAVLEHPEATLMEIVHDIQTQTNFAFAASALHYYLKRNDVTYKKVGLLEASFEYQTL